MKLKFTRKTWYFFLLAAAAMSMLGGFAVLGGMDFSGLELIVFCITGIAVLFLAALLRLDWFTRNLPYRILGQQPLAAAEEKDKEA